MDEFQKGCGTRYIVPWSARLDACERRCSKSMRAMMWQKHALEKMPRRLSIDAACGGSAEKAEVRVQATAAYAGKIVTVVLSWLKGSAVWV